MRTPLLINVPKTHPSRKEKLEAFKKLHGIWTHLAPKGTESPWTALLVPSARELAHRYKDASAMEPYDLIAGYCRLLDERNLLVNGDTERDAIEKLCRFNGLPLP